MFLTKLNNYKYAVISAILFTYLISNPSITFGSETTYAPSPDAIAVFDDMNRIPQFVRVSGLSNGDIIKVYDAEFDGQLLGESQVYGSEVSQNVDLLQLADKFNNVYVSVTKVGKQEGQRIEKQVISSFAPELTSMSVSAGEAINGDSVTIILDVTNADDLKSISLTYKLNGKSSKSSEQFIELNRNALTGKYEGIFNFSPSINKGNWEIAEICLHNQDSNQFVFVNSSHLDSWVGNNQEHRDLSAMDIRLK